MRIFIFWMIIALSFGASAVQAASSVGTSSGRGRSRTGLSTPRGTVGATGQSFRRLTRGTGIPELQSYCRHGGFLWRARSLPGIAGIAELQPQQRASVLELAAARNDPELGPSYAWCDHIRALALESERPVVDFRKRFLRCANGASSLVGESNAVVSRPNMSLSSCPPTNQP